MGAANPPFGVDWKKVLDVVKSEHEKKGFAGRFGPGLPRISDGSLLFLMHLISKMRPAAEGGGRIGPRANASGLAGARHRKSSLPDLRTKHFEVG